MECSFCSKKSIYEMISISENISICRNCIDICLEIISKKLLDTLPIYCGLFPSIDIEKVHSMSECSVCKMNYVKNDIFIIGESASICDFCVTVISYIDDHYIHRKQFDVLGNSKDKYREYYEKFSPKDINHKKAYEFHDIGNSYFNSKKYMLARPYYLRAIKILRKHSDFYKLSNTLSNLSLIEQVLYPDGFEGKHFDWRSIQDRAIDCAKISGNNVIISKSYRDNANYYSDKAFNIESSEKNNYKEKSISYFLQAFDLSVNSNLINEFMKTYQDLLGSAVNYVCNGDYKYAYKAIEHLESYKHILMYDDALWGEVLALKGDIALKNNEDVDKAMTYYDKALKIINKRETNLPWKNKIDNVAEKLRIVYKEYEKIKNKIKIISSYIDNNNNNDQIKSIAKSFFKFTGFEVVELDSNQQFVDFIIIKHGQYYNIHINCIVIQTTNINFLEKFNDITKNYLLINNDKKILQRIKTDDLLSKNNIKVIDFSDMLNETKKVITNELRHAASAISKSILEFKTSFYGWREASATGDAPMTPDNPFDQINHQIKSNISIDSRKLYELLR